MMLGCSRCQPGDRDPAIDIAFQPIFDARNGSVRAYEALVRGPNGEGAASVLTAVGEDDKHRFEQCVRVRAIEKAAALGIVGTSAALGINILPSAVTEAAATQSSVSSTPSQSPNRAWRLLGPLIAGPADSRGRVRFR